MVYVVKTPLTTMLQMLSVLALFLLIIHGLSASRSIVLSREDGKLQIRRENVQRLVDIIVQKLRKSSSKNKRDPKNLFNVYQMRRVKQIYRLSVDTVFT